MFSLSLELLLGPGPALPVRASALPLLLPTCALRSHAEQVNILCLEMQAATRGTLLPDPRFDKVLAVTLVVRHDGTEDAFSPPTSPGLAETLVLVLDSGSAASAAAPGGHAAGNGQPDSAASQPTPPPRPAAFRDALGQGATVVVAPTERALLLAVAAVVARHDPDILVGWDIQRGSLGYVLERAGVLGLPLLKLMARAPAAGNESSDDSWGRLHGSNGGIAVTGRIVLNLWRQVLGDVKLGDYCFEACCKALLRERVPRFPAHVLAGWHAAGPAGGRWKALASCLRRGRLVLRLAGQLDLVRRTAEHARVFGLDFTSVLSRGSQFRVESLLARLAHSQNFLLVSPSKAQARAASASARAMHTREEGVKCLQACAGQLDPGPALPPILDRFVFVLRPAHLFMSYFFAAGRWPASLGCNASPW